MESRREEKREEIRKRREAGRVWERSNGLARKREGRREEGLVWRNRTREKQKGRQME